MCARCDTRPTARRRTCSSACRCSSDSGPILTTVSTLRSGWLTLYQAESGLSSVQVLSVQNLPTLEAPVKCVARLATIVAAILTLTGGPVAAQEIAPTSPILPGFDETIP